MKVLGLIAGKGGMPVTVAADARARGYRIVAVALNPVCDHDLSAYADVLLDIHVGKLGEVIKALKKNHVSEAVIAGKFSKTLLYGKKIRPDLRAAKLLFSLKDKGDDTIINAVAKEIEKEGVKLPGIAEFCKGILTPLGTLTRSSPSEAEWADIRYGFTMAKEVGRLGIGQTVIVKDRAVMAVEAIEGTDEAIGRGGKLAGEGAVVVKVLRPGQDPRFDVPVAGLETLAAMLHAKAKVLALEAGRSIFLDREEVLRRANAAGVSVVGVAEAGLK